MKKALFLIIILSMAGCTTAAQRQFSFIQGNLQVIKQKIKVCAHNVEINPDYQGIANHAPIKGDLKPTLEQLLDSDIPTEEDIRLIIAIHNEMETCRNEAVEDMLRVIPGIVPIFVRYMHANDLITVDLIQGIITWGEANKRKLSLKDEFMDEVHAFEMQLKRDLLASHNNELAQRQAALDSLSQWAYQQQILRQNQKLINFWK